MALKLWPFFFDFGIALSFFRNSSDFFRNSSDFFRNSSDLTLWRGLWGPSGNPWNLFENWASETDDMLPDAIPRNTQFQGLTTLSMTWSVYYLCVCVAFILGRSCWCDVDSLHVFLTSISQPEHAGSGSDWLGYVPPLLSNLGRSMCRSFFQKFFGIR